MCVFSDFEGCSVKLTSCALVPVYASIQDLEVVKRKMAKIKTELLCEVVTVGVSFFSSLLHD
jgi:hypothetical protein